MKRSSRQTMIKLYAQAVISELQQLGYPNDQAKAVFFRHYRDMKRLFGLEQNVCDFAKMIDEFERAMQKKHDPSDPNSIAVGHLNHLAKTYILKHKSSKMSRIIFQSVTDIRPVSLSPFLKDEHVDAAADQHIFFFTTERSYQVFIDYWNSKMERNIQRGWSS